MISISTSPTILSRFFFIALFTTFLVSTDVFSQGKFLDGYVISLKGDTLKGTIKYEEWDASPSFINFTDQKGVLQKIFSSEVKGFFIIKTGEKYESHRIGILNIDLRESYNIAPSLETRDSSEYFLEEIVFGLYASLLAYKNTAGVSHYFLKKGPRLTELYNYSFYKTVNAKKYLIDYDEYKNQLPKLLSDSEKFSVKIPSYDRKSLKAYIEKYNESLGATEYKKVPNKQTSDFNVDVSFNAGVEGWEEPGMSLNYRPSYGMGIRFNLARNFYNRYVKLNYQIMPGVQISEVYPNFADEKVSFKALEVGVGTYFGIKDLKPFLGLDCSFPAPNWRTAILGPQFGFGYRRQFNLEVSHLVNIYSVVSKTPFFTIPRISLSYYLNLNTVFKRK